MLQEERHKQILEELEVNQSVRISHLSKSLRVTKQTIRRDLSELERVGLIKKVHGGAVLNQSNVEPSFSNRVSTSVDEKQMIAQKAAELVKDGDAIFLDIGTTTLLMAKKLKSRKKLTVITNSLLIAIELAKSSGVKVIVSGGELRGEELSLSGPISTKSMNNIFIDKAFIGVGGLAMETGYTDYHLGEADFRNKMIQHAKVSYALADYSKIDVTAIFKSADIHDVDVLITDEKSPKEFMKQLEGKGIEVITVSTQ